MAGEIAQLISSLKEKEALDLVQKKLDQGVDPLEILAEAREGLKTVGEKFSCGDYFIPDLVFSGEILNRIAKMVEPFLKGKTEEKRERRGKVIIGTVKGDIHDIGKSVVAAVLQANGYDVVDLGIDVEDAKFVKAAQEHKANCVAMSSLLTLTIQNMGVVIQKLKEAGIRNQVKVIVGGAPVTQEFADGIGADAFGHDAADAVKKMKLLLGK